MTISDDVRGLTNKMVQKLVDEYDPEQVILFGSYAYGNPLPDSDIDLLIIKETTDRPIDRWAKVRQILSDPQRMHALDALVLTPQELSHRLGIGDQFVAEILEKGQVLYAA
jgi:predicted nucleotidyltransferase